MARLAAYGRWRHPAEEPSELFRWTDRRQAEPGLSELWNPDAGWPYASSRSLWWLLPYAAFQLCAGIFFVGWLALVCGHLLQVSSSKATGLLSIVAGAGALFTAAMISMTSLGLALYPIRWEGSAMRRFAASVRPPSVSFVSKLLGDAAAVGAVMALAALLGALVLALQPLRPEFWLRDFTWLGAGVTGFAIFGLGLALRLVFLVAVYFAVQDVGAQRPSRDVATRQHGSDDRCAVVNLVHISDVHLTADDTTPTTERKTGTNATFQRLVERHRSILEAADAIVLSGDITDRGRQKEWNVFLQTYPQSLYRKTVLVPGNHDLNMPNGMSQFDLGHRLARRQKLLRMMRVMDTVAGTTAAVIDSDGAEWPLRDYLWYHEESMLDSHSGSGIPSSGKHPPKKRADHRVLAEPLDLPAVWLNMFPLIQYVNIENGPPFAIYTLDSNDESDWVGTNAYGNVHISMLRKLCRHAQRQPTLAKAVALHHHIDLPVSSKGLVSALQVRGMVLMNARTTLGALKSAEVGLALHGHRHVSYGAARRGLYISSAASATVGDESPASADRRAKFHKLTLSVKDGRIDVVERSDVPVDS